MIKLPTPFYSSWFLKIFFSLLTSAIQQLFGVPLISSPLIDQAITHAYPRYPSMHVTTSATWVALSEFLFAAVFFWLILHLLGKRPKLIALVGTAIMISVIIAKLILI